MGLNKQLSLTSGIFRGRKSILVPNLTEQRISVNTQNPAEHLLGQVRRDEVVGIMRMLSLEHDKSEREGGVLAIAVATVDGSSISFGSCSIGKTGKKAPVWAKNAAEKIARLQSRRSLGFPDVASSESADPTNENELLRTYGGCLVFCEGDFEYYVSFSGAPPLVDEAVVFIIGKERGLVPPREYTNPLLARALEIYERRLWVT